MARPAPLGCQRLLPVKALSYRIYLRPRRRLHPLFSVEQEFDSQPVANIDRCSGMRGGLQLSHEAR